MKASAPGSIKTRKKEFCILCIDDSRTQNAIYQKTFKESGYQVVIAENGVQGINILDQRQPDIIILDIDMPVMNGITFLERAQKLVELDRIHIVVVSGRLDPDTIDRAFDLGAKDYIRKPFSIRELKKRIELQYRTLCIKRWDRYQKSFLEQAFIDKTNETQETKNALIFSMARLAESRDPKTHGHLERIQKYVKILAEELSTISPYRNIIDDTYIENIYNISVLHDIGKIGIPDSILLKPGVLDSNEFEIMKRHTVIGGQALESITENYPNLEYLQIGKNISYYHHEKWNGGGYPKGLAGTQIPLESRIVTIADVYDALSEERVYKKAFPPDKVDQIMASEVGKSFDPEIFDIYLKNKSRFEKISAKYSYDFEEGPLKKKAI